MPSHGTTACLSALFRAGRFTDNGDLTAVRYDDWKVTFKTIKGNLFTGTEESTNVPLVSNLRQDPWERYQEQSMLYGRWWGDKLWTSNSGE
jgi:arylsulfatase